MSRAVVLSNLMGREGPRGPDPEEPLHRAQPICYLFSLPFHLL